MTAREFCDHVERCRAYWEEQGLLDWPVETVCIHGELWIKPADPAPSPVLVGAAKETP